MLSRRLKAFVIPTSQSRPIAHARTSLPTISTFRPLASTTTAAAICAASFATGLEVPEVVDEPGDEDDRDAGEDPAELARPLDRAGREREQDAAEKPAKIPTPPNSGVGCVVPALVRRDGDEPRARGRAEEEPENRGSDGERGDRHDRDHNRERVVERPAALDCSRCPFTPT